MHKELWFPTPIWIEDLRLDLTFLEKFCYTLRNVDTGKVMSNAGGWQSQFLKFDDFPELTNLKSLLETKAKECTQEFGCMYQPKIQKFWVNINSEKDYNKTHIHDSFFSGVLYIKSNKDSGLIKFSKNFDYQYIMGLFGPYKENILNAVECGYPPSAGRLVIFPSWLPHSVETNNDTEDRISLAFDITLEK